MIHITDSQTDRILDFIDEYNFWEDEHYKSLKDTLETFNFVTFANKRYSEHLAKRNRIIIPDEDGKYVEFIINNTRKFHDENSLNIKVYTSASYIDLTKAKIIKPQTTPAWTAKQHAEWALAGTEWQVGDVDFEGTRTITIEQHTNPYSFLKRLASEFDLELHFRVEVDGIKVVRRYVDLIKRVGVWQGREVEFGKDLIGIERKEDFSNIVTALIGLGPEREDGTRLEVFVEDKDALARWGRNGQHIVDVYEPESTDQSMTEERLRELTKNELEKRINSIVEYTADIADLEKVPGLEHEKIRFGDTIKIKDTTFTPALYLEARVHTVSRSIKQNGYKTVTLGDYIEYTEEQVFAIWKSLKAEIAKKVSLTEVMEVTYTKTEIDDKDAGVYQDSTQYADNVSETKKQEAIQVSAVDATNKAQQAENNAKSHANSIAEQKKQEAINAAIADADAKLSAAKTELEADIALKADAEWVNGQLQLKENAIHRGTTAPTDTTKLWLDTSIVPNVLKRYDSVTSSWVKATPTSAGEVGAYTKTEVNNALNSKVSVTQYNTDMNGIITELDNHESRITQTENEIATKVSNTQYQQDKAALENDISALETRMSNAETSITQNANQIALKANKTDVYTKTEIDGQFSTVNQQISQLDAELSVQADQIATKVSRTEFEALQIGGRNYVRDSLFQKGNEFWNFNGPGTTEFVDSAFRGYRAVRRAVNATVNVWAGMLSLANGIEVSSGDKVTASVWYKVESDADVLAMEVEYFPNPDRSGGRLGTRQLRLENAVGDWKYAKATFTTANFEGYDKVYAFFRVWVQQKGTVLYTLPKLEIGNRATDWTPAPEDVQGQIDGLGTRVNSAETSITQLSNQIQLKANQTTVDTLANRISSAESTINLLSDEIDLKVNKNGVISAINVSSEGVRIDGAKVRITGQTTIDNGVIKNAHIDNLKFDKLQGGTATLGGNGNGNGLLQVLDANNNLIFRADQNGIVDGQNRRILGAEGLLSTFNFMSSGPINGWQECAWWGSEGASYKAIPSIRFFIPGGFVVTKAELRTYSLPVYWQDRLGGSIHYIQPRGMVLFKLNDYTNQFYDYTLNSDNFGIAFRGGSAVDITQSVWGVASWNADESPMIYRMQGKYGDITNHVRTGYNEFYIDTFSGIKTPGRNTGLIQFVVTVQGYQKAG